MKTIQTLFDEVIIKDRRVYSPSAKLRSGLLRLLNESVYKFKIAYNRVYYGKISAFPKGIDKDNWLRIAQTIWDEKEMEGKISVDPHTKKKVKLKLLDVTKANQ